MKIVVTKNVGYCMGVKRSLKILDKIIKEKPKNVYLYKDIIHNKETINKYKNLGVKVNYKVSDFANFQEKTIVGSAHGLSIEDKNSLLRENNEVIDTTCPYVSKSLAKLLKYQDDGYTIIYLGDKNHDEGKFILNSTKDIHFVETIEEIKELPKFPKAALINQTTNDYKIFLEAKTWLESLYLDLKTVSVCSETKLRQQEFLRKLKPGFLGIVVGDKGSRNTNKLVELGKSITKTIRVTNETDINKEDIINYQTVVITTGASTASETLELIIKKIKSFKKTK